MQLAEGYLKPGGIIFFSESDISMYYRDSPALIPLGLDTDERGDPEKGSWMQRIGRGKHNSIL
jgi:hypothetical protein